MLVEEPLVLAQFAWNKACKYRACSHCLRPLETAQESVRCARGRRWVPAHVLLILRPGLRSRMAGDPRVVLPHPECCDVNPAEHVRCIHCQVPLSPGSLRPPFVCQPMAMDMAGRVLQ